jgi:hypothetical protein
MVSTHRVVATRHASSDNWGELSIEKGIPSLPALGSTPFSAAAPLVKIVCSMAEKARKNRLSSHSMRESCATKPGELHTFEVLQATGVRPFGYQGLITLDYP